MQNMDKDGETGANLMRLMTYEYKITDIIQKISVPKTGTILKETTKSQRLNHYFLKSQ